ncbi:MAG TPA: winged helix DNA-binding domain-containing protein [Polyangiales bacterium]|nr:winged helix DNA-binding domain-containing protein [Polyangiales bacterium]
MAGLRDIALLRLRNQRLVGRGFDSAAEVVSWLGAVQAQDYAGAKWALGQRMAAGSDAAVERAFKAGSILRTHVLRPTWHFVAPADIRWMLNLTAPRVRAAMRYYDRQLGLGADEFARSHDALGRALEGERHLTRTELAKVLDAQAQRLGHLLMRAELDGLICSGPRRGKQFTYALIEERVPKAKSRTREQALRELCVRYFRSHGPALPQDFAWWSGLTIADAKAGLELARGELSELVVEERSYWFAGDAKPPRLRAPVVHLLPNYDEHLIAYKERSAAFDRTRVKKVGPRDMVLANHLITLDGRVVGGWRRPKSQLELTLIAKLEAAEKKALKAAEQRLAGFLQS